MIHLRRLITGLCLGIGLMSSAMAQEFPNKTITIVVPFSAGGGVDIMARLLADKLRISLKQNVIVENKAGGSGMIGALAVGLYFLYAGLRVSMERTVPRARQVLLASVVYLPVLYGLLVLDRTF